MLICMKDDHNVVEGYKLLQLLIVYVCMKANVALVVNMIVCVCVINVSVSAL